jgi:hypothetical protein
MHEGVLRDKERIAAKKRLNAGLTCEDKAGNDNPSGS